MSHRFVRFLRNPIVLVVPFVAVTFTGWNVYVKALNKPNHADINLLQNAGFETVDWQNLPRGWIVDTTSTLGYSLSRERGYGDGHALGITIETYRKGALDFKSETVPVKPNAPYFFKGYYRSNIEFSVLVKSYYTDGTSTLRLVRGYNPSKDWTTSSLAFRPDERTDRIQIVYRLAAKGTLQLDRAYLEERKQGVFIPEELGNNLPNLIKNGDLNKQGVGLPEGWSPYDIGNNSSSASYVRHDGSAFVRTEVSNYRDGEAKWSSPPVAADFGKYTQFSVEYRSDVPTRIVAEYVLDDKKRSFATLTELPPANNWTKAIAYTEAPARAVEVTLTVVLSQNGTLDTDNYIAHDLTNHDEVRHFNRPLVSLTFDDGWDSSYVTVARILGYLKYKGTFYVNPDSIDKEAFLTTDELKDLKKGGHQLASEGYEYVDLTTLNDRQLDRQLRLGKEYFVREFGLPGVDFAPPNGRYDPEVQSYAREYYRSARTTDEGLNTKQDFDAYKLKTLYIDKNTTLKRLQGALDEAKQKSGWLILVYHRVEDNKSDRSIVAPDAFAEQLELIKRNDITVKTVEGALDELWAQ